MNPKHNLAETKEHQLELPAELETYLPPDLWRKLSKGKPQRKLLTRALDRLRSLLYLLSTFIPSNLVQEKMKQPVPGKVRGEILKGSLLFADVSGFTALSERLAVLGPEGAERLTATMNNYFATMLEILAWSGGILLKFAGDAMLVYFPGQRGDQQAQWAVRAGVRMLLAITDFSNIETPVETISLKMKVGVATGEFLSASVGSAKRMEYAILGEAISQTMGAEDAATGPGQLVINQATADYLDETFPLQEQTPGYCRLDLDKFKEPGRYEISAEMRRARGAIPFDLSLEAVVGQMQDTLDQIHALRPYIADELVERIIAQAQRRRFDSEFLLTTVIFCNFIGPEKLLKTWGKKGTSRVTKLLSAYFTAMSDVISRHGGMISRIDPYSKGTKLLGLFGAPISHQDDPLRAVRAALMMNVELENLNQLWVQKFTKYLPDDWEGSLIQHRIGITVGDTFAGPVGSSTRREYTVMGDDVNLSARLMGAAKMGQILISQPVHESVKNYFYHTDLPPIKVKGKSKPISIYQVDSPRTDILLNRMHRRGRLIGRNEELTQAEECLNQALKGNCTAITIQGPAGIGKSHLADTLLKQALSDGSEVHAYQCKAYNSRLSFACWSGILRSLAGITTSDPVLLHKEKFQNLLEELNIADQHAVHLAKLIGLDYQDQHTQHPLKDTETTQMGFRVSTRYSEKDRQALQEAIAQLLIKSLEKAPLVLFFENAHWMDEASRDVISDLLEKLNSQALAILIAQRNEYDLPALGKTILLGPLDQAATNELVAEVLVSDLAKIVHQHSNGSPLFINEIAHWIRQTWQINTDDIITALSSSDILQNLVLSNLKNLPENQRQIAQTSSVIGDEFRVGELQALLPTSVDTVTLYNDLRALTDVRFITLTEAGVDPRYTFQQRLVRDVLYNSLPFALRRELHARMADYLSSAPSQRSKIHTKISAFLDTGSTSSPSQDAHLIAHHYEAAEQWQDAAGSLLLAANRLLKDGNYQQAGDFYQRALDDLGNLRREKKVDPLKQKLYKGRGDSAFLSGDYALAAQNYRAALDIKAQDDLKRKLALTLPILGQADEAEKLLQELAESSETEPDLATAATRAWLAWRSNTEDANEWIAKNLALLPSQLNTWSKGLEALLLDLGGHWEDAIKKYQAIDRHLNIALASLRLGDQYLQTGNVKEAYDRYEFAAKAFQKIPEDEQEPGLVLTHYRIAEAHWQMEDQMAARASLNEAQALLDSCHAAIRKETRKLIISALESINTGSKESWPAWRWQHLDDISRVKILF